MQTKEQDLFIIPIEKIKEPEKAMRLKMDPEKYEELKESIREIGLIEPLIVKTSGDFYEIIAGHRRYIACGDLGFKEIPCIITKTNEEQNLKIKYHENAFREDLSTYEEAVIFRDLITTQKIDTLYISKIFGRTESYIKTRVELFSFFPELITAVKNNEITLSIAKEMNQVDDMTTRSIYLSNAINNQVSLKKVREWVGNWLSANKPDMFEEQREKYENTSNEPIYVDCMTCGEKKLIENTRLIRMCNDCISPQKQTEPTQKE